MAIGLLALLIIDVILFAATTLLTPRPKLTGITAQLPQQPTSKEGDPLPVVWGTVSIPANITVFSTVEAKEETEKVATGLFSSHNVTVGYSYSALMQVVLCHGVVDELVDMIWQDIHNLAAGTPVSVYGPDPIDGVYTVTMDTINFTNPVLPIARPVSGVDDGTDIIVGAPELFGGFKHGGGSTGHVRMYWGTSSQNNDDALGFASPPTVGGQPYPALRGVSHIVFGRKLTGPDKIETFDFGEFGTVPPLAIVVRRCPSNLGLSDGVTNIGGGANPAECIYELLINTVWGLCVPTSEIDAATFVACANTLADEGFGLHLTLSSAGSGDDTITEILRYVDGQVQQNPVTGLLEMSLNRADYDVSTLVALDDNNSTSEITRPSWTQLVNQIKVQYTALRGVKFLTVPTQPIDDLASQREFGVVHSLTVPFLGVRDAVLANQLAVRSLRTSSTPLQRAKITTNRIAAGLKVGTPFKLSNAAAGVNNHVFRAISLDFGERLNGAIKIDAIEDIFNLESPMYNTPIDEPSAWTGVGPVGPVRVQANATHDAATGFLELIPIGGSGLATAVQFREQTGNETISAWHDNTDTTGFKTQVDLDEKHPSLIGWRIQGNLKDGSTGTLAIGEVQYPISTQPAIPALTYSVDSVTKQVTAIFDLDADAATIKVAGSNSAPPSFATVNATSPITVTARRMVVPNVFILSGSEGFLSAIAYDSVGNPSEIASVVVTSAGTNANQLALLVRQQSADDTNFVFEVYVSDAFPDSDAAIVVSAEGQGVPAVAAEDGSLSAVLTTRGNFVESGKDITGSPWSSVASASAAFDTAVAGPDGVLGVTRITFPSNSAIWHQVGSKLGDYNGVPLAAEIWMRNATAVSINAGIIDQSGAAISGCFGTFAVTSAWQKFSVAGTPGVTTSSIGFFIQCPTSGSHTVEVYYPTGVVGTIADVTDSLASTDFIVLNVTRPAAGDQPGRVNLVATRDGAAAVVQSIDVQPSGVFSPANPTITIEVENTSEDGNGEGMAHIILGFDRSTQAFYIFTSESELSGGNFPDFSANSTSYHITRHEGVIADDDNWVTGADISITPGWFRQIIVNIVDQNPLRLNQRLTAQKSFEVQAVDTGSPPSGPPTGLGVAFTSPGGVPRATITFTAADATAEHVVFRNGYILERLAAGVATLVDDGLIPDQNYNYNVQAIKNGQTSEFAVPGTGGGVGGTGGTPSPLTLVSPTFDTGFPSGGPLLTGTAYVQIRVVNPDPLASTEIWMNATTTDTGLFTKLRTIGPGVTDYTVLADDVGVSAGTSRWFYLVATRTGYTNSVASSHATAAFGADF